MRPLLLVVCVLMCAGNAQAEHPRDPYENFNRKVFWLNESIDKLFLKPIAKRYVNWTPALVQAGVSNFFSNLEEIGNAANNILQGKPKQAGGDLIRFVINTSVGLFGVLDTASRFGIARSDEDLGQTLGRWGVSSGPYMMVPFLGPRTLRDAVAWYPDSLLDPTNLLNDDPLKYSLLFGEIIDLRARLLPTERMIAGDRYTFIRDAYLQRRDYMVRDGELADDAFDEDLGDDFFE